MREVVIVSACRTPIGKFNGALASVSARELAITAGKEAIRRAGIDASLVDEIVMGELYIRYAGLPACPSGGNADWSACAEQRRQCEPELRLRYACLADRM